MSKTLEGMARAVAAAWFGPAWIKHERQITDEEIAVQKAALLWLADNVSDEMVRVSLGWCRAYWDMMEEERGEDIEARRESISAALRAAAREAAQ